MRLKKKGKLLILVCNTVLIILLIIQSLTHNTRTDIIDIATYILAISIFILIAVDIIRNNEHK